MQIFSFTLIILSGLFGLIYGFKITNKFAKVINWIMVVAIAVSFIPIPNVKIDGFYLFALTHLLVIVYAVSHEHFTQEKKLLLAAISLLSVAPILIFLGEMQGIMFACLLSIVGIGIYVYILIKDIQSYKEEIGFLTMLVANSITWFVGGVIYFVNS